MHSVALVAPVAATNDPAGALVQDDCPAIAENFPTGQRTEDVACATATYEPAGASVHAVAPVVGEKEPTAHAVGSCELTTGT